MQSALGIAALHDLLFHDRLGETHVGRALHLCFDQHRVQGSPAIVRHPDRLHVHEAGLRIDLHFRHVRRETVRRRRPDRPTPVLPVHPFLRRVVVSDGAERPVLRFGELERRSDGHAAIFSGRVFGVIRPAPGEPHPVGRDPESCAHVGPYRLAHLAARVHARVAHHQRLARGIGAQVHGDEVRVCGQDAHVGERHAKFLGRDRGHGRVRALSDFRRAMQDADPTGALDLHLHGGLRHIVGVDRVVGARDIARTGDPYPSAVRELAVPLLPIAGRLHRVQAFQEAVRLYPELVHRPPRTHEVPAPQFDRIHLQFGRHLVERDLEREARLHGAVTAFRPARRLVRVHPCRIEPVGLQLVWSREELTAVVGGHESERGVRPAIQQAAGVHRHQLPLVRSPDSVPHAHRVPATVRVEQLLSRVQQFHRASGPQSQQGDAEFEIEGLRLAAEGAPHRRLHDPNEGHVQLQDARQLALQVVRHLGRRPHGQQPVRVHVPDRAVRLDGCVRGAVEKVVSFDHHVRRSHEVVDRPELELDLLGDVAVAPLALRVVDRRRRGFRRQRVLRLEIERQDLVLHLDSLDRRVRRLLVHRRHARHGVPDVPYPVQRERVLVARPRDDPIRRGHVRPRNYTVNTGYACCVLSVE